MLAKMYNNKKIENELIFFQVSCEIGFVESEIVKTGISLDSDELFLATFWPPTNKHKQTTHPPPYPLLLLVTLPGSFSKLGIF